MVTSTLSPIARKTGAISHIAGALAILLLVLGFNSAARADAGFVKNFIVINANSSGDVFYKAGGFQAVGNTNFNSQNLGNFARNGSLFLNGGQSQIFKNTANVNSNITGVRLYYRVYRNGATAGAFTLLNLPFASNDFSGNSDQYQTWQSGGPTFTDANINLLNSLQASATATTYTLEVYFEATDGNNTTTPTFADNNNNNNYKATFTVDAGGFAPANGSTTWISNTNTTTGTDWLQPANWSNGVPTQNSDALIPDHATGTPSTVAPQLSEPTALYEVRNLNMPNANFNDRSLLRLGQSVGGNSVGATLRIYGNFTVPGAGLLASVSGTNGAANPATNSTLVFAGNSTQFMQGDANVIDVRIEGTGDKKINGTLEVPNTLTFITGTTGRLITTDASGNYVAQQSVALVNLLDSGTLFGETNSAYILGTLRSDRPIVNGVTQTFGNVGIDITANRNIPSPNVKITRTTGVHFTSTNATTTVGINRIYGVSGDVNNSPTVSTVVFHYLDSNGTNAAHSDDNELNGIQEGNIVLFRTSNGNSGPYTQVAGTLNTTNNTVTVTGATAINTITAGDATAPLPVVLTKFEAVRTEANALLTWTTASETDSKGFYVQVATDGVNFRDLTFVPSQSTNSLKALNYTYLDKETGKTGKRYYRLLQVDLDGKSSFSSVKVVSFNGTATPGAALVAYPNPFTNDLSLTIDGGSVAHVQLVDATGRLVMEQKGTGDAVLALSDLRGLNSGLYLAKVTMADGSTQTVRIQKQ